MRWEQPIQYASISDTGFRRQNNQDSCIVQICSDRETWQDRGHLFLVADGMGGHAVGELASKIAVDTLPHTFYKIKKPNDVDTSTALMQAIVAANTAIHERGAHNRDFEAMGTTCTALVFSPQGAAIGHVGDSRAYRIRDGHIDQLTFDHSLQWELMKQGRMSPDEIFIHQPRNVITRSLGPGESVQIDMEGPYPVLPGDTYLLCSDGLTAHLSDAEIGALAGDLPPGEACRLLVNLANLRGGSDNISIVIARAGNLPSGLPADPARNEPAPESGLSWQWLAGLWGIAAAFVAGVSLALFREPMAGVILIVCAVVAAVGVLLHWMKKPRHDAAGSHLAETTLWRPYRTASAKFSQSLLSQLAAIEAELQRTATEEGWSIDRQEHESAYNAAKTAIADRQYRQALRHFAKAIDVLMAGVHLQRKQMNREAKWGKSASGC